MDQRDRNTVEAAKQAYQDECDASERRLLEFMATSTYCNGHLEVPLYSLFTTPSSYNMAPIHEPGCHFRNKSPRRTSTDKIGLVKDEIPVNQAPVFPGWDM